MGSFDLQGALFRLIVVLPALTFHEFAHAYSAYKLGDPTPHYDGRVSLNPLAHIDPIGTILVPLFAPFGWAKPVRINPLNFRNPARDIVITSVMGPASNIVQAVVWAVLFRAFTALGPLAGAQGASAVRPLLYYMVLINLVLAFFNLIPLGPLDGHEVLAYFLPYPHSVTYRQLNQYGFPILLALIFVPDILGLPSPLDYVVFGPAQMLARLLAGV
jgi:Zn-dependent protease